MLTSLAHTAVCVPDVEEAVRWYESVLGLTVIWPPVLLENEDIEKDMGELIPKPVAVKGAILGVGLIENDAGLAAAVLFLSAFTIALSVGMALRPLEKGRE